MVFTRVIPVIALTLLGQYSLAARIKRAREAVQLAVEDATEVRQPAEKTCQQKCEDRQKYSRWRDEEEIFGRECPTETGATVCKCSPRKDTPCDAIESEKAADRDAADTVNQYCDAEGLAQMQGKDAASALGSSADKRTEAAITADIAEELEGSNADRMAKEMFTFYVCTRWVPDPTFMEIVKQELASQLIMPMQANKTKFNQVVAELYQHYKYLPLLCSRNMNLFEKTDSYTGTYFRRFEQKVGDLVDWLQNSSDTPVGQQLKETDEVFCGEDAMNSWGCQRTLDLAEIANRVSKYVSRGMWHTNFSTRGDAWSDLEEIFLSFRAHDGNQTWNKDLASWHERFPYHSFIDKPGGMSPGQSPHSNERFLVCFGKRVASQMHRRPAGQHILTDQNNIGCHGWWEPQDAAQMLQRIVKLWRPPTCVISTMSYTMKNELMLMFKQMNEQLFDALPGILNDEKLESSGLLDAVVHGSKKYNRTSQTLDGTVFVDGMRVRALEDMHWHPDDPACAEGGSMFHDNCLYDVHKGEYGVVKLNGSSLTVMWDDDSGANAIPANPDQVQIMPHGWKSLKGFMGHITDAVAGVSIIANQAQDLFNSMFLHKYDGLAEMMSESVSKWAVCPIKRDVLLDAGAAKELDAELGVEDASLQDFQKNAYSAFTGYQREIPGEHCVGPSSFNLETTGLNNCQVCEISEFLADHFEKYVTKDGQKENFMCPAKPLMPSEEQLAVLAKKEGQCFMHMTKEQEREYEWHYRGKFPARRQYDRMENPPSLDFEMVKLLQVSGKTTSIAKTCSRDELMKTPRFCQAPKFENDYDNTNEMAEDLATSVEGSLGVGGSAIFGSISRFTGQLRRAKENIDRAKEDAPTSKEEAIERAREEAKELKDLFGNTSKEDIQKLLNGAKNRTKEDAYWIGENILDKLTGVGRFLGNSARAGLARLNVGLPGAGRRDETVQDDIFENVDSAELLHSLSFQRSIANNGRTSNAKERFNRYIVTCPCQDFDPAREYASRHKWGNVALRMLIEAVAVRGEAFLETQKQLQLLARGEARLFERKRRSGGSSRWFEYGSAMRLVDGVSGDPLESPEPLCNESSWWRDCEPTRFCQKDAEEDGRCHAKKTWSSVGWWETADSQLTWALGAPSLSAGSVEGAPLGDMKGLRVKLFCGKKKDFRLSEGPQADSFMKCLKDGILENSRLHSRFPFKTFFEDETVVMATFQQLDRRGCKVTNETHRKVTCAAGAELVEDLLRHLDTEGTTMTGAKLVGVHAGAGFPKATVNEVVLRPEDLLEALGRIPSARAAGETDFSGVDIQMRDQKMPVYEDVIPDTTTTPIPDQPLNEENEVHNTEEDNCLDFDKWAPDWLKWPKTASDACKEWINAWWGAQDMGRTTKEESCSEGSWGSQFCAQTCCKFWAEQNRQMEGTRER